MKTALVTCEYNPFHNGHKYQLEKIRDELGCDCIICLMSGDFVQRGDAAIFDKHERAKAACMNGADLVLELPFGYSSQTAQVFASGAVRMADKLGVDNICFSATKDSFDETIELVRKISRLGFNDFNEKVESLIIGDVSYANARVLAMSELIGYEPEHLSRPNDILSIEYALEAARLGILDRLVCFDVRYDETTISASKIREKIIAQEDYSDYIPYDYTSSSPRTLSDYSDIIKYALLVGDNDSLIDICEMNPDLVNRLKANVDLLTDSVEAFIDKCVSKNYTRAKLRRSLVNLITYFDKKKLRFVKENTPSFYRVLAANDNGRKYLNELSLREDIQVAGNINKVYNKLNDIDRSFVDMSLKASSIYNIFNKDSNKDYKDRPVIISEVEK